MRKNPNQYYDLITQDVTRKNVLGTKARQIDYLMIRKNIQWIYGMTKSLSHFNNMSDHKPLTVSMMIPDKDLFKIPMINTKLLNKYLNEMKEKPKNVFDYMKICNNPSFYGIKYVDYEIIINKKFSEVIEATKALLFSKKSKEFYNIIQHSKNLKPYKKEGSKKNCIQLLNGNMIFDQKQITSLCIEDLILIQQEQIFKTCDKLPLNFKLSFNKETLKKLRSNKKAVSFDLVELKHLVNYVDEYQQLDIDFDMIISLDYLFSMRMVPLNKMHPAIPLRGQFRPIMVISHFVKMFECHYVERFKKICTDKINASQIGFVSQMGCSLHIASLVRELQSQVKKKQKGKITIFFDLSNAYNCVRRDIVFKNLRENPKFQGIFNPNELYALEWIYDQLYIYDPILKKKVFFQNGVHQGSMLAPFLFDIYFDQLIEDLQRKVRLKMLSRKIRRKNVERDLTFHQLRWTKIFAYADDVAITTFGPQAEWLISEFIGLAQKYNFKVNIQKSNYITNLKNVEQKYDLKGIQRSNCFKYLGVLISPRGSIEHHRKMIKNRINYLCSQLSELNKFLPIRHMTQLWNSYIKPHLDYVAPLMRYFKISHLVKWQKLQRQSIKKMLKLPQFLSNEEIDKIWKQFGFRPNAILHSTSQQLGRLCDEMKQTKFVFQKMRLQEMVKDINYEQAGILISQDQINQKLYAQSMEERMIKSNLKIKYIPNKGYLDRYKHAWRLCKCGERWNFNHLNVHDLHLKKEYELFEEELNSYLLSGSQIYVIILLRLCVREG